MEIIAIFSAVDMVLWVSVPMNLMLLAMAGFDRGWWLRKSSSISSTNVQSVPPADKKTPTKPQDV
jgi:hypothetical protein